MIDVVFIEDTDLYCEVEFTVSGSFDYNRLVSAYNEVFNHFIHNENKQVLFIRKGMMYDNVLMNLKVMNKVLTYLSEHNCKNKIAFCYEKAEFKNLTRSSPDLILKYKLNVKMFVDCKDAKSWLLDF